MPSLDEKFVSKEPERDRRSRRKLSVGLPAVATVLVLSIWYFMAYFLVAEIGQTIVTLAIGVPIFLIASPWWMLATVIGASQLLTWVLFLGWMYIVAVVLLLVIRGFSLLFGRR